MIVSFAIEAIASVLRGMVIGILKLHAYAPASISLLTLPVYMKDHVSNFVLACIMAVVSFAASFLLTYFLGITDEIKKEGVKFL